MVKLRDAKCPNCGANIQVNDKLENTICQYCGSQVIIEEAIEKYKLELSGSVEVDGIQGRGAKLRKARKHIKIREYDVAKRILQDLTFEDSLDTESYIELLKLEIMKVHEENFDENRDIEENLNFKQKFQEIKEYYDRIKKIDDENIADKELADYQQDLDKYIEYLEKIDNFIKERDERIERERREHEEQVAKEKREREEREAKYTSDFNKVSEEVTDKLNGYLERAKKISGDDYACYNDYTDMVKDTFRGKDGKLSFIAVNEKYNRFDKNLIDIEDLKTKSEELFQKVEPILQEYAKKRNVEIDKYNKEVTKVGKTIKKQKKARKTERNMFYAIIMFFILCTILMWIGNGFASAVVVGIVWDSWLIPLCIKAANVRKEDIKECENNFEKNEKRKLEHVY